MVLIRCLAPLIRETEEMFAVITAIIVKARASVKVQEKGKV